MAKRFLIKLKGGIARYDVTIIKENECPSCLGDGWVDLYDKDIMCPTCNGEGKVKLKLFWNEKNDRD